jgi:hypothetical protein
MGFRKSAAERREATAKAARNITTIFWAGSGSETSLLDAEAEIRALKLTPDQLHDLRAGLPLGSGGVTGAKVARIDRVLKRLEKSA